MLSNILKPESIEIKIPIKDEQIIGIDLGTTFSCAGIIRKDKVEIVPDSKMGEKIIPSIICYFLNQLLIGRAAAYKIFRCEGTSMTNSKRLIGHLFCDENVQNDIKFLPPIIYEDNKTKKPIYRFKVGEEEKSFFPEDVSSMILKYIKDNVNAFEGKEVKKAVITVPAHFNNTQREATKEAAKNAGLEVIRIINEPTAAAIAYGNIHKSDEERKILIFDLGGGTFDVSIVIIKGNEYTVLASCGEEHLGGENFNELLVDYLLNEFKEVNTEFKNVNFYDKDDKKAFKALQRVREQVETIKRDLSVQNNITVSIDSLYKNQDLEVNILRTTFEDLCLPLWKKCFKSVDKALSIAKLDKKDIDDIILVGGSTRIPKIKEMINNYFNKTPKQNINADEIVAQGATLYATLDLKINDITSKSIGIQTSLTQMEVIIPKGTPFPSKKFNKYFTCKKNSKQIVVRILEGDNEDISKNKLLTKLTIELNEKYNEKAIYQIIMYVDCNSILKIKGKINDEDNNEVDVQLHFN